MLCNVPPAAQFFAIDANIQMWNGNTVQYLLASMITTSVDLQYILLYVIHFGELKKAYRLDYVFFS